MIVYECTYAVSSSQGLLLSSNPHHMTQKILKNESPVPVLQFNKFWSFGDFCLDYKQFVPTTNEVRPIGVLRTGHWPSDYNQRTMAGPS